MKKITGLLICILLLQHFSARAQSFAINTTGTAAHASAMMDVTSTTKGLLIPRLTTAQRTAIASPGKGLLVYDSTLKSFYFHDGVNWQQINADSNNLWRKNGNDIYNSNTGNVGIGVSSPKSLLNVRGGAILFDSTIGGTPVSGAGTRMMWIPAKAALRAGIVSGTNWDDINIGLYSIGLGFNTKATGGNSIAIGAGAYALADQSISIGSSTAAVYRSTAFGAGSTASATDAVVMGYGCTSAGISSFAMGSYSGAYGAHAFAMGDTAFAIGDNSVAMGNKSRANSISSIAMGDSAVTGGNVAFATGYHTNAGGNYSTAMGYLTNASGLNSTAIGTGTKASGFFSTAIGNGSIASGGNSTAMGYGTTASNLYSTSMGYFTAASGSYSVAMGWVTKASGDYSTAMGISTIASGFSSTAMGAGTIASGNTSTAMGGATIASGNTSTAMGAGTIASGDYCTSLGYSTKSKSFAGLTIGLYNDSTNAADPFNNNSLNRIFQIGNGTADNARSNAMTVLQNGNIGIGELNPTSPLNFASTLGDKIALWGNGSNHYGLGIQPSLLQLYTMDGSNDIAFGYGSSASLTENVRFKGNGNVGIGTNNPNAKLNITGSETTANGLAVGLQLTNTASTNSWTLRAGATGTNTPAGGFSIGDNAAYRLVITSGGNVGIGTTAPIYQLELSTNSAAKPTSSSWNITSDERLKTIDGNYTKGLKDILKLNTIMYHYKKKQFT